MAPAAAPATAVVAPAPCPCHRCCCCSPLLLPPIPLPAPTPTPCPATGAAAAAPANPTPAAPAAGAAGGGAGVAAAGAAAAPARAVPTRTHSRARCRYRPCHCWCCLWCSWCCVYTHPSLALWFVVVDVRAKKFLTGHVIVNFCGGVDGAGAWGEKGGDRGWDTPGRWLATRSRHARAWMTCWRCRGHGRSWVRSGLEVGRGDGTSIDALRARRRRRRLRFARRGRAHPCARRSTRI